jgi:hypothetical protein
MGQKTKKAVPLFLSFCCHQPFPSSGGTFFHLHSISSDEKTIVPKQGDRDEFVKKIAQNVAQPIICQS